MSGSPSAHGIEARRYYDALDGLRALAVTAVLLFHARTGVDGGWLGVDLFMVLSGWLVSSIFYRSIRRDGGIRYGAYVAARYRRLMPAVYVLLIGVSVLAAFDLVRVERRAVLGALTWSSNWVQLAGSGGYWEQFQAPSPLEHLWSLAVEEQFYVVWPLVVVGVCAVVRRIGGRRPVQTLRATAAVLAAASLVLGVVGERAGWSLDALYLDTGVRAFPFLLGAALGGWTGPAVAPRVRTAVTGGAGAVLVWQAIVFDGARSMFAGRLALVEVLCAVVVVGAAGMTGGPLTATPLRALGHWSYGIYLFHWPVVVVLREHTSLSPWLVALATAAISVPVAAVSFRFVETPLRAHPWTAARRHLPRIAVIAPVVVVVAVAAYVVATPAPVLTEKPSVVTLPARTTVASTASPSTASPATASPATASPATTRVPAASTSTTTGSTLAPTTTTSTLPPLPPVPAVVVAGDSTAMVLSDAVNRWVDANPDRLLVGRAAGPGCGLTAATDGRTHDFWNYDDEFETIDISACATAVWAALVGQIDDPAHRPDVVVVEVTPWDVTDIRFPDGRVESIITAAGAALVRDAYEGFVDAATAQGVRVVFVEPAPANPGWHDSELTNPARWAALRSLHRSLAENPLVTVIDQGAWLTANGLEGADGRPDGVHLDPDVADRWVAEALVPSLFGL